MKIAIVGAGPAGITLSRRLLELNSEIQVDLIDAGPRIEQGNRRSWLDFVARGPSYDPYKRFRDRQDDQEQDGLLTLNVKGSRYFGAGGSTNAWGGWCLRYRPEDFCLHSNTGEGVDWPYSHKTLTPFYKRAEQTLWVAGKDKPNPPLPFTLKDGVIIEALNRMGIKDYGHLPLARKSDCLTIGTCKYCPILKRYVPHIDLQHSESNFQSRFKLHLGKIAFRLHMRSKSNCEGVFVVATDCQDQEQKELIEADLVVLALGAIETPKLLLASCTPDWPNGVGNNSKHVGRHITAHPLIRVVGTKKGNPDNLEQPVDFPTLVCREFDTEKYQEQGKLLFVRDGRKNYVKLEEEIKKGKTLDTVRNEMRKEMPFELRGFIEIFSEYENRVELANGYSPVTGIPRTKVHFKVTRNTNAAIDWALLKLNEILEEAGCRNIENAMYSDIRADHATSTCRMSKEASNGVVDENLKVHETDNLFVCSNAAIPNGAAVNPTLTLIALTEKLASHISTFKHSKYAMA